MMRGRHGDLATCVLSIFLYLFKLLCRGNQKKFHINTTKIRMCVYVCCWGERVLIDRGNIARGTRDSWPREGRFCPVRLYLRVRLMTRFTFCQSDTRCHIYHMRVNALSLVCCLMPIAPRNLFSLSLFVT